MGAATQFHEMDPAVLGFEPINCIQPDRLYLLQQLAHYLGEAETETLRKKFIKSFEWIARSTVSGNYLVDSNSVIAWLRKGSRHE